MGRGALPACRPPYPQPAATRSGRAAALYGSAGPSFWRCAFRRSRRRAYVLYSPNSPLLVHRDLCAQRSTTLRGLEMTAKFVARARARRCAVIARIITRSSSLVMMHPRVRHKHVDYRTGEVSLTTSKRGARELVYFTRGRDGPLFISDRLCACDVSLLRASARVCDGARFACYVPASILLRRSLSATKPV